MQKIKYALMRSIQAVQNFVPLFLLFASAMFFIKFGFSLGATWGYLMTAIVSIILAYLLDTGGDET